MPAVSVRQCVDSLRAMARHLRNMRRIVAILGWGYEGTCPLCSSDPMHWKHDTIFAWLDREIAGAEAVADDIQTRLSRRSA